MQKAILFLGDSFTWGEGLELYCDTPKWIAERNNKNEWMELAEKQDDTGVKFRENSRFPTLVAKHFNKIPLVDFHNGGCLTRNIHVANGFLFDPNLYIDTIIVQFSILDRDPLHLSFSCKCDFCQKTEFVSLYTTLATILKKKIENESLTPNEKICLDYFESEATCKITDPNFLHRFELNKKQWYSNILLSFYNDHILRWNSNGSRKIYFIDSWDNETSFEIEKLHEFTKTRIPLIGADGLKYPRWSHWENTFFSKNISHDFPKTENKHPTLEQHQYLAKSIINFLEEINYE